MAESAAEFLASVSSAENAEGAAAFLADTDSASEFLSEEPPAKFSNGLTSLLDIAKSSPLGAMARGTVPLLKSAAEFLEPVRTPVVGLGGIAAGVKAAVAGEPVFPAAAKSIEERKGLGREIAEEFIAPGLGQEVATLVLEIATDPVTYITPAILTRIKSLAPQVVKAVGTDEAVKKVAGRLIQMTPEESVAHLSELARATKGPEPLIKPILASTPMETMLNAVGKTARPRLASEQALQGAAQTTESMREVAQEVIRKARQGKPISVKEGQQISEAVAEAVATGEIDPSMAAKILGTGMTHSDPVAFAQIIRDTKTQQGRALAQWSRVARELQEHFKGNKAVQDLLAGPANVETTAFGTFTEAWRYVDNIRRAAMTSQLATTARNLITSSVRFPVNALEDAASGILGKLTGKTPPTVGALDNAMQNAVSAVSVMGKNGKQQLAKVLDEFPLEAARLLNTPIGDVASTQKVARFLNTFNIWQETLTRKIAFDARLRQTLALAGKNIDDVRNIKTSEVRDAVQHALELTWAKSPASEAGKAVLHLYNSVPFLTALGNPFPRFWLNALRFVYDFSPMPLLSPQTYKAMAHPDPRIAFKALNRSIIGSGFVGAGMALDEMGLTGERWYEVRSSANPEDRKRFDMRAYGPFTAHLFAGRLLNRLRKTGTEALFEYSGQDWSQAFLAMKRTDAAGVPLLDILFSRSQREFKDNIVKVASGFVSSFTPGLLTRTPQDIIGQFSKEERTPRYTRENRLVDEFLSTIPFASRTLHPRPSPLRAEPELRESPGLKQITGVTYRVKTPVEIEADRLKMTPRDLYPRTGSPEYDRLITEKMGPLVEKNIGALIESRGYLEADDKLKAALFKRQIQRFRGAAKRIALGEAPKFIIDELIRKQPEFLRDDMREALLESKGEE